MPDRQLQETLPVSDISDTALHLLLTAERLFADCGIASVSTRQIAREAGQKNTSALHYHFGDKSKLIEAILDYRISPVNRQRLQRLQKLKKQGSTIKLRQLVELFVEPFVFELLKPAQETGYIIMLSQLYASYAGRELYASNKKRARELHEITTLMVKSLSALPVSTIHLRLQILGRQTISSVAEWDEARRYDASTLNEETLRWRCAALVDFLTGGLLAAEGCR